MQTPNSILFDLCATNDNGRLFYPTIEAVQYILGGDDILHRLDVLQLFNDDNILIRENIVTFSVKDNGLASSRLSVSQEAFSRIVLGKEALPKMSDDFPAEQIYTRRSWDDLILPKTTLMELQSIEAWYNSS